MKRVGLAIMVGLLVLALGVVGIGKTQQIKLFGEEMLTIDGSRPCYVAHGWTQLDSDLPEGQIPREYLIENYLFELVVDGSPVSPTNFTVRRVPEARNDYGEGVWTIVWYFRFPPNYFSEEVHEFYGVWYIPGPWERTRMVNVTYPSKSNKKK